jgi:hypothetical protein
VDFFWIGQVNVFEVPSLAIFGPFCAPAMELRSGSRRSTADDDFSLGNWLEYVTVWQDIANSGDKPRLVVLESVSKSLSLSLARCQAMSYRIPFATLTSPGCCARTGDGNLAFNAHARYTQGVSFFFSEMS